MQFSYSSLFKKSESSRQVHTPWIRCRLRGLRGIGKCSTNQEERERHSHQNLLIPVWYPEEELELIGLKNF